MTIRLRAGQAQSVSIRDHVNAHNMSAVTAKRDTHIGISLLAGARISTATLPISLERKHKEWLATGDPRDGLLRDHGMPAGSGTGGTALSGTGGMT
jgi:hypothetical protein